MGLPKRLTEMQKRFAEYLVFNEGRTTGADAAIAAGYSEKRCRVCLLYTSDAADE